MNSLLAVAGPGEYCVGAVVALACVLGACVLVRCWGSVQESAGKGRWTQMLTCLQLGLVAVGLYVAMSALFGYTKPQLSALLDVASGATHDSVPAGK